MVFGLNMAAFATGVFEQSMDNARERKAAEIAQAELDAENKKELAKAGSELIFNLFGDEKITGEQASTLTQLNKQGYDITSAAYSMVKVMDDVENTSKFGTGQNEIVLPFGMIDIGNDEDLFTGLTKMEGHLAENYDSVVSLAKNNEQFKSYLSSIWNRQNEVYFKDNSGKDEGGKTTEAAYYDWEKASPFMNRALQDLSILPKTEFKSVPKGDPMFGDIIEDGQVFIPDKNAAPNEQTITGTFIDVRQIQEEYGVNSEQLNNLSVYHGMTEGIAQVVVNGDYITYGDDPDMTAQGFLDDDSKIEAIAAGSLLLDSGGKNVFLLAGGANLTTLDNVSQVLTRVGKGNSRFNFADEDIGAMTRAVFTITKPDPVNVGKPPTATTGINGNAYMKKQGVNVGEFIEQDTAGQESVRMLRELYSLQETYVATGLTRTIEQFSFGLVGQAKQLKQVFFGGDPTMAEFTQNLTDDTTLLDLTDTAVKYLGINRNQQLNRIDALKLTLAAKMARAVDPSGRLSNQDFEIQLQRLGQTGIFTTQEGSLEKLKVVLEEFEARDKNNAMLRSIINKDEITVEDRRFIKAYNFVKTTIDHRRKQNSIRDNRFVDTSSKTEQLMDGITNTLTGQGKEQEVFDPVAQGLPELIYGDGLVAYESTNAAGDLIVIDRDGNDVTDAFVKAMKVE
tara:strand:- start:6788 stop:8821 length:2034 start_codon:yes stop_codon:yes gene_type:complete